MIFMTLFYYDILPDYVSFCLIFQRIQLHFSRFELDNFDDRCYRDRVYIHDGRDALAQLTHTICSRKFSIDNITSSGNTVFVYFASDGYYRRRGFEIQYSSVEGKRGCYRNECLIEKLSKLC